MLDYKPSVDVLNVEEMSRFYMLMEVSLFRKIPKVPVPV